MTIPRRVDALSAWLRELTLPFIQTKPGKLFLSLVLVGPLTFIPTVYNVWTAENIDAFRSLTWPLMVIVNASATVGLAHKGDWQMRLAMIFWTIIMAAICIATIVR